ncbi:hypothetical protein I6A94_35175, partial [Frankia sp. CN4]|nr:hypothetical protein [Frankia nepalensis]
MSADAGRPAGSASEPARSAAPIGQESRIRQEPRPLRVVLDATPLLGQRTGVGRYVENLLAALADLVGDEALGLIREFGALAPGSGAVDAAGASAGARSPRAAGP